MGEAQNLIAFFSRPSLGDTLSRHISGVHVAADEARSEKIILTTNFRNYAARMYIYVYAYYFERDSFLYAVLSV